MHSHIEYETTLKWSTHLFQQYKVDVLMIRLLLSGRGKKIKHFICSGNICSIVGWIDLVNWYNFVQSQTCRHFKIILKIVQEMWLIFISMYPLCMILNINQTMYSIGFLHQNPDAKSLKSKDLNYSLILQQWVGRSSNRRYHLWSIFAPIHSNSWKNEV